MAFPDQTSRTTPARPPPMAQRRSLSQMQATTLMLLAALAWGSGNVSQKLILDHLDPFAANGITCLIGALVLLPLARREAARPLPPIKGAGKMLFWVAATFTLAATLMQIGYGLTTVTNAGFMVNTAAVMTPILAWLAYRQRPAFWIWPASFCSMAGVLLMGGGGLTRLATGDLLSLASALCFAVWTLVVGRFVVRYQRPILLTVVQLAACGSACTVSGAFLYGLPPAATLAAALPELLYLGLVSKGLAYMLMAVAQERVPPTSAAVLVSAEAVFGAIAAALLLGEAPGPMGLVGGALIFLGVTIAAMLPSGPALPAHRPARPEAASDQSRHHPPGFDG